MQPTHSERFKNSASPPPGPTDDSIDAVYEFHHRELWTIFYAFCNDVERASDALQEVFLRLQRQDLAQIRNPREWLLHVGRNWLRDVARTRKRTAASAGDLHETKDTSQSAWLCCAQSEKRQIVRDALDRLSEHERLTLILRFGMQWPAARIAETLECTPGAVDMRLCRARKRLRDVLLEMDPEFAEAAL